MEEELSRHDDDPLEQPPPDPRRQNEPPPLPVASGRDPARRGAPRARRVWQPPVLPREERPPTGAVAKGDSEVAPRPCRSPSPKCELVATSRIDWTLPSLPGGVMVCETAFATSGTSRCSATPETPEAIGGRAAHAPPPRRQTPPIPASRGNLHREFQAIVPCGRALDAGASPARPRRSCHRAKRAGIEHPCPCPVPSPSLRPKHPAAARRDRDSPGSAGS